MDVSAWAREGLVDWVSPCNFFVSVDFDLPVSDWKKLVANSPRPVRIVPGADSGVAADDPATGKPVWRRLMTLAEYREWAHRMQTRGADGLYLFNLFTFLEKSYHAPSLEPWNVIRKEGLSPKSIKGRKRAFPKGWKYEP